MKKLEYFSQNFKVATKEMFERAKLVNRRVWIVLGAFLLAIIIIVASVSSAVSVKSDPKRNPKSIATNYAEAISNCDYYNAIEYTMISKDSFDKYLKNNCLKDVKKGSDKKLEDSFINDMAFSMESTFNSTFVSTGMTGFSQNCETYFNLLSSNIATYQDEKNVTRSAMIKIFERNCSLYQEDTKQKNLDANKSNYNLTVKCTNEKKCSKDELKEYLANLAEEDKALAELEGTDYVSEYEKCSIKSKNIKAITEYTFDINVNEVKKREMNVYMIKVGSHWYVDLVLTQ